MNTVKLSDILAMQELVGGNGIARLPYHNDGALLCDADDCGVFEPVSSHGIGHGWDTVLQAATLAHCVNIVPKLIKALRKIQREANFEEGCGSQTLGDICIECENIASEVLAKVEKVKVRG